jgi:hypothetical protein
MKMTYFYKNGGTISRKIGGEPPANEYVAIDPQGVVRHIKDDNIVEEIPIDVSSISDKDIDLYKEVISSQMAKDMLYPKYRKKINKPKSMRKIKVVKKCICK